MKSSCLVTPAGMRDILFEECRAQREVQARLSKVFRLRGYSELMTPGIEYYDVFRQPGAALSQQEMYTSSANNGRLLVFRPDSTLPIARVAAARLKDSPKPVRLFYNQSVYRNRPDLSGRDDETAQLGVELLGAGGLRADLEVIATAAAALSECVESFRIEIGHAGFFKAISNKLPVDEEKRENLREAVEMKNYAAVSEILSGLERTPAVEAAERLPRLFGGEEALREAEKYCSGEELPEVLEYLKRLYSALRVMGLNEKVIVDLGLVQRNDYYTGMVFCAYVEERGKPVALGGRYDRLLEKFGDPMPAVGFAADADALAAIMLESGKIEKNAVCGTIVHAMAGYEVQAQKLATQMVMRGESCESSVFGDESETFRYAADKGIGEVICVGEEIKRFSSDGKELH